MNLLPLAHIVAKFILDGKIYEVESFKIGFEQPVDYKGQPQHETRGGQMYVVLPQAADKALFLWAKTSTLLKDGIVLFQTDLGVTVLEITFENAYCISMDREINAHSGTKTSLVISAECVKMNGVEHHNFWP
jgi:hypothetical protein